MPTDAIPATDLPTEPFERFDMRANFEGLIQLLARNLYPEPDVFVRELIQNGHDSIRLRQEREPGHAGRIDVMLDAQASEIIFRDNGLGMDRDDIREFLSVIGSTGTGTARARFEEANHATAFSLIGQFGIGMLSAFVVAERVTVTTRKLGSAASFIWENEGRTECRLRPGPERDVGTEIVVSVARAHGYMLRRENLTAAIVRYCDFLPLPVFLNGNGPVNVVHAPWDRDVWPSEEAREAAYREFVSHRYPDVPLEVIPVEIEEPVRARGALYISDRRIPDMNTAGVADIFVRRMFVRGDDAELLPPWARFVRGLIECPDLQPTAGRDNIRRDDWAYKTLRARLADLIIGRLCWLAEQRPVRFREINRWHHYHLKGMALLHDDFFDRVGNLLLFETNRGLLPLGELVSSGGRVHYFSNAGAAPQFYRLADARGWTVINASLVFEKELLQKYARSVGAAKGLVAVNSIDDGMLFEEPHAAWSDRNRLEQLASSALAGAGLHHIQVEVRRFPPDSLPAVVLLSPESEADLRLRSVLQQAWFIESLGDVTREFLRQHEQRPVRLRLNERHPLIGKLLARPDCPHAARVCIGLYLSAALNANDLLVGETVSVLHGELVALLHQLADSSS